ncbi:DUF4382 domain-containing protein [Natronomonas halophila]|uniref:DUF4382 domain-containing protein n=1 Tax=Natronomonas halophila TaxID=2747817 RepID=UPI0015B4259C|nr:DUF4382 domain-containing protein [Natronomonas halophila]QLD84295.1 DUF4382 domain-containing protein [Natronomonas halophila]
MKDDDTSPSQRRVIARLPEEYRRREVLAVGGGLGATLLAGCVGDSPSSDEDEPGTDSGGSDDGTQSGASFRLLISDAPADIDDFDRLDVTFDSARIFDGGDEDDDSETETPAEQATETPSGTPEATETEGTADGGTTETEAEEDEDDGESDEDGERGFYTLDLDDPTVDLTQVVGAKAMPVFDGELEPGTYQKVELNVASTEGIVDGEPAAVKVPSEKLQITKPFEVRAGESLDFVFDINVVKRGQENSYILKPVISQSGVAGEDVDVEEVDEDDDDDESEGTETPEETETQEATETTEATETPDGTETPTATPQETSEGDSQ